MPSENLLKHHILKNDFVELILVPGFGCHWIRLKIKIYDQWIDWLAPVERTEMLLEQPNNLGSYLMAPWSNRIPQGKFRFKNKEYQVRMNFPDNTSIHGDVRKRAWTVISASSNKFEAVLNSKNHPDFNFPFALEFRHTIEIKGKQLIAQLAIKNLDDRDVPAGMGFHPFFQRKLTSKDQDVILMLPAEKVYPAIESIPTGKPVSVSNDLDLRLEQFLGNPDIDHCYTDLTTNRIQMWYPGSKVKTQMECDPVLSHVIVYARHQDDGTARPYFAIEPVTHATNGFNLFEQGWEGTGVHILYPGITWTSSIALSFEETSNF